MPGPGKTVHCVPSSLLHALYEAGCFLRDAGLKSRAVKGLVHFCGAGASDGIPKPVNMIDQHLLRAFADEDLIPRWAELGIPAMRAARSRPNTSQRWIYYAPQGPAARSPVIMTFSPALFYSHCHGTPC